MADNINRKCPPKDYPPYRVFWNWELTHNCNYKCSYCPTWRDDIKTPRYYTASQWKKVWDRIFDRYYSCLVRFSGGEPSIYPEFIDIVSAVAEKHSVDITTNLSFNEKKFVEKVRPGAVAISASFHPEYNDIDEFIERVLFLHNNGFVSSICYVAYPPYLKDLGRFKAAVEKQDLMFKFIPFTGTYERKKYPGAYTEEEKNMLELAAEESKDESAKKINTGWYEWNAKKRDSDKGINTGKICRMGQMYAIIKTDGRVTRCCAKDSALLGNFLDKDFKLLEEPAPCEVGRCPCFKAMLSGLEEKWGGLWDALEHPAYKVSGVTK